MIYDKPLGTVASESIRDLLNSVSDTYEEIIKEGSYLFYNFDDVLNTYQDEYNTYKESIDPSFSKNVVNELANQKFLETITEEVPLYHRSPELEIKLTGDVISHTRDTGILNVPSALQNEFWTRWFSNAWGDVYNNLLLYTYNSLRYPFINENQYLNAYKLPEIAAEGFKRTGRAEDYLPDSEVRFRYTAVQNDEDLEVPYLQGCQDYLEDIVQAKINSVYSLLDYKPDQSLLLTDWVNSLYESSLLSYDDLDREQLVFKLQDIQYELLKRKFAGSSTLYKLALSSIARTGSLVSVTTAGWNPARTFYDTKIVSYPYIPGITDYQTDIDRSMDPFTFYQSIDTIPTGIALPLYYSSSVNYNSDIFYGSSAARLGSLRETDTVVNVNSPFSITSVNQTIETFDTLDYSYLEPDKQDPTPLKLDRNDNYPFSTDEFYCPKLDTSIVISSVSYQSGVALNITANKLLFHKNTLQASTEQNYELITAPTAGNNSVSLMDLPWVNYIKNSSAQKSRVQDTTTTGIQVSRLVELPSKQLAEHYFFTVSYNEVDDYTTSKSYEDMYGNNPPSGYAYLWYCTVKYDVDTFSIEAIDKSLLSKITLSTGRSLKSSSSLAQELVQHSIGVVPLTYENLSSKEISELKLEVTGDLLNDTLSTSKWGTAYFFFSSYDLANDSLVSHVLSSIREADPTLVDPTEDTLKDLTSFLSSKPCRDTRNIFFVVKKQISAKDVRYEWSSPVKVLPYNILGLTSLTDCKFNPDWRNLVYHLNPILNYDRNTATILRSKKSLIPAATAAKDDISYGLCNLARERNNDIYCNDTGSDAAASDRTFYLNRVTSTYVKEEDQIRYLYEDVIPSGNFYRPVEVYGDNRYFAHEKLDELVDYENETALYADSLNHYCLSVQPFVQQHGIDYDDLSPVPNHLLLAKKLSTTEARPLTNATVLMSLTIDASNDDGEKHLIISSGDSFHAYYKYNTSTGIANIEVTAGGETCYFPVNLSPLYYTVTGVVRTYSSLRNNLRLAFVSNGMNSYVRVNDQKHDLSINFLSVIHLFSELQNNNQVNTLYGNLYDLRIYDRALSDSELEFTFYGSLRELFTYSPSSYKMAYWTTTDLGAIKQPLSIPANHTFDINQLRCFSRSVWDSILLDTYPVTSEEQDPSNPDFYNEHFADPETERHYSSVNLIEGTEVKNNLSGDKLLLADGAKLQLSYNNKVYETDKLAKDSVTFATTMLTPTVYEDAAFHSLLSTVSEKKEDSYTVSTLVESPITLPVKGLDVDTIGYSADLVPLFELNSTRDFTSFHSRGTNIEVVYNKSNNCSAITLNNENLAGSRTNSVLTSFIIPDQSTTDFNNHYIDRILLHNVQLSSAMTAFLNANNFYNEARIPLAALSGSEPVYLNKWDAIRTLKEGTYYFTCKYPLQILPFTDYNISKADNYATIYGTARFKVEVTGNPLSYNENNYAITGYPSNYDAKNLNKTLAEGSTVFEPFDNKTFPHREIKIDLYVMDCDDIAGKTSEDGRELYTFTWKKLASNTPESGILLLDRSAVGNSLELGSSVEIPLFFSKNYLMPFFVAKYNKSSAAIDSLSADDDLIEPIYVVKNERMTGTEKLSVDREEDLDHLTVIGGNSYKLLFDYTGKLTELSYTNKIFGNAVLSDTSEEKKNFARLTNLLETTTANTSDYLYSGTCSWYNTTDPNILTKSSGYETTTGAFIPVSSSEANVRYFGNPYKKSSSENYLLSKNTDYRDAINNLAYFPYRIAVPSGISQIYPGTYYSNIWAISGTRSTHALTYMDFDEVNLLRQLWESCRTRALTAINSLVDNPLSVFSQLRSYSLPVQNDFSTRTAIRVIISEDYDLYGYKSADRTFKVRNDKVTVQRRGVYTNNFIVNQDFLNVLFWKSSTRGTYVSDDSKGKDVVTYHIPGKTSTELTYLTGGTSIKDTVETAISVAGLTGSVSVAFLRKGVTVHTTTLSTVTQAEGTWKLYEAETPVHALSDFDSIKFIFANTSTSAIDIRVTSAILRRSIAVAHKLGLSEVYYDANLPSERAIVVMSGHSTVVFNKKGYSSLLPITFPAVVLRTDRVTTATPNNETVNFITNHMLSSKPLSTFKTGSLISLLKPWVRRVVLRKGDCYFAAYERDIDVSNQSVTTRLSSSRTQDIFYLDTDSSINLTDTKIDISNLYLNSKLGALTSYNLDLAIYNERPLAVLHETFSGVASAFDTKAVLNKAESIQCITNLQYIGNVKHDGIALNDKVLFEIEYAPIIYNETDSHLTTYFFALRRDIV